MAFWFYRGLRKGIATTRYPASIEAWTRDLPTPPAFHSSRLTDALADRLASGCPAGAIAHAGNELIVDLGRCGGCGRCLELGEGAVEPSGEFLLATGDRRALLKHIPIRGDWGARDGRG